MDNLFPVFLDKGPAQYESAHFIDDSDSRPSPMNVLLFLTYLVTIDQTNIIFSLVDINFKILQIYPKFGY